MKYFKKIICGNIKNYEVKKHVEKVLFNQLFFITMQ